MLNPALARPLASWRRGWRRWRQPGEMRARWRSPLLRRIRQLAKHLAPGRQEDTHDFLYCLLGAAESILLAEASGKARLEQRWVVVVFLVVGGGSCLPFF